MKHNDEITVSLKAAKKLAMSNWPQNDCIFAWSKPNGRRKTKSVARKAHGHGYAVIPAITMNPGQKQCYAAPTAQEILTLLPTSIYLNGERGMELVGNCYSGHTQEEPSVFDLKISRSSCGWEIEYEPATYMPEMEGHTVPLKRFYNTTSLADAASEMWCFLSDNLLFTPYDFEEKTLPR